jgi:uncharacterized protein YggE
MLLLVLISVCFIFAAGVFALSVAARSNESRRFIRVTSSATVAKPPDEASVTIGYRTDNVEKQNLSPARTQNATQFAKIIDALKSIDSSVELETRSFIVAPTTSPPLDQSNVVAASTTAENKRETLYTIYSSVDVRVKGADKITLLPALVDAAVENGSNSVGNVYYSLSNALQQTAANEAKANAMRDADTKAAQLASAAHRSLGSVQQIVDDSAATHLWRATSSQLMPAAATTTTPLLPPRELDVTAQVSVQYSLL